LVKPGDAISLVLPSNPTSGYRWVSDDPDGDTMDVTSSGFQPSGPGVGTGGVETWTIHARAVGRARVSFRYWRPWAGESSVVERFAVTVAVGR